MMLRRMLYSQLIGTVLYGVDGIRVGQVRRVLVDEITGRPEWVAVSTGALGARQRLVPVAAADLQIGGIRVPYPAAVVLAAPRFDPRDAAPNQGSEEELYRHYDMDGMDGENGEDGEDGEDGESPPIRLPGTDQNNDRDQHRDADRDAVCPVADDDGSPTPAAVEGWDLVKVRQLLEHTFSYPQQPAGPAGETAAVDAPASSAESDAGQHPHMTGGAHVDRCRRS